MDDVEIISAAPDALPTGDRSRLCDLVFNAGEVGRAALATNMSNAKALVILRQGGDIRGAAALKRPQASYRVKVAKRSGFALPSEVYPYELGYVVIDCPLRPRGLSHRLIAEALAHANGVGIFSTVRTDNVAMRRALTKAGFVPAGQAYPGRDRRMIGLLVKKP